MYETDDYVADKRSQGHTTLKRVFFFTYPVVAYKVKIHKMFGDEVIAFKVDFLGTDEISQKNPFKDGTLDTSTVHLLDEISNSLVTLSLFQTFNIYISLSCIGYKMSFDQWSPKLE